jgi:glycosyltransferase involved in cell wall biosynthesis
MNGMANSLFSILIANYNNGRFFNDCYNSIIAQSYSNWEVIIVDDCSSDNSVELIKQTVGTDSRFMLYTNEYNRGCGYTKHRCVELATGAICGFLDPDDLLIKDALSVMVSAHMKHRDCSLIYSKFFQCNEQLKILSVSKAQSIPEGQSYLEHKGIISHFVTFKLASYKKTAGIGVYLKRAVDQDLYLKLEEVGKCYYIDQPIYFYRQHPGGISTHDNYYKAFAWNILVVIEACKRRGLDIELILSKQVETELMRTYNVIDYKIGHFLLKPFRILKRLLY